MTFDYPFLELYNDVATSAENLGALCTGEKGIGPNTGVLIHFKTSGSSQCMVGSSVSGPTEKSGALRKTKSQIFTNSSASKLKLGDLQGAQLDGDFAIHEVDDNPNAFFRQGQVRIVFDAGIKRELAAARKKVDFLY